MIYADITELVGNPIRSGIQRVVRSFLSAWVPTGELKVCRFDYDSIDLIEVPDSVVELLLEQDEKTKSKSSKEIAAEIQEILKITPVVRVPYQDIHLVIPELFFDPLRVGHYEWRLTCPNVRLSMLFYDFIPWLYPDAINVHRAGPLMPYLKLSTKCDNASFISQNTYDDWRLRILREPERQGVVLPLGADGLELEQQYFDRAKCDIVCLGSIDGRKNQDLIAQAFEKAWEKGLTLNLVLVGYAFDKDSVAAKEIRRISARWQNLVHVTNASDQEVLTILRKARATIYMSSLEGFGLPPLESLHAGIPVVVGDGIPSLNGLPEAGQIRVPSVSVEVIEDAIWKLADDRLVARLWKDAQTLVLPTWDDFGRSTFEWLK